MKGVIVTFPERFQPGKTCHQSMKQSGSHICSGEECTLVLSLYTCRRIGMVFSRACRQAFSIIHWSWKRVQFLVRPLCHGLPHCWGCDLVHQLCQRQVVAVLVHIPAVKCNTLAQSQEDLCGEAVMVQAARQGLKMPDTTAVQRQSSNHPSQRQLPGNLSGHLVCEKHHGGRHIIGKALQEAHVHVNNVDTSILEGLDGSFEGWLRLQNRAFSGHHACLLKTHMCNKPCNCMSEASV